jgi:hypothetical protein
MDLVANIGSGTLLEVIQLSNYTSVVKVLVEIIAIGMCRQSPG